MLKTALLLFCFFAAPAGALASPLPTLADTQRLLDDALRAVNESLATLAVAHAQESDPAAETEPPESDSLFQAFLVAPAEARSLAPGFPLRPCVEVRQEKRRMDGALLEMGAMRREVESLLEAYRRSGGKKAELAARLNAASERLRARAQELRPYYQRFEEDAPDRFFEYRLRLHGPRAAALAAYYEPAPEVKLLRVRFAARRWMEFPTESFMVREGLAGPPKLEADGTWTLSRSLNAYQACTRNLAFALEFLTRWRPRPGTPATLDRGVTVRTHAWVYDR